MSVLRGGRAGLAWACARVALVPGALFASVPGARADDATPGKPALSATLEPAAAPGHLTFRVTNAGTTAARIPADPRFLVLDLARGTTRASCVFPADARPAAADAELVIDPSGAWSFDVDRDYHCADARARALFAPGSTVTAKYRVDKGHEIASLTLALPAGEPEPPADALPKLPQPLSLRMTPYVDSFDGRELSTSVTVVNETRGPVTAWLRPHVLSFDVEGPTGATSCHRPLTGAPIRELYTHLAPRGTTEVAVLLSAVCPRGTFSREGVYRVTAALDTRMHAGRALGLNTFDGVLRAGAPSIVRIRTTRGGSPKPRLDKPRAAT